MAITDNLISFWELEAASGTRNDSHGTNHLNDNATVTQTTGKVGNCAQFTAANSEYLNCADSAGLSLGTNVSWTFCAWVYLDSLPTYAVIASKSGTSSSDVSWDLYYDNGGGQFTLYISTDGTSYTTSVSAVMSISTATWYFIVGWYDFSTGTLNLQVNNGTVNSTSAAAGAADSGSDLRIGARYSTAQLFWNGRIDQVGFWKRVLLTAENTDLFNSGNGRTYAYISGGGGGGVIAISGRSFGFAYVDAAPLVWPPALPVLYDTTYVAPTGSTIVVGAGGDFQAALNAAVPGQTITLNAGSTYTANFGLPSKGGSAYIHIRSSAALTTEGVLITPAQAASFPKIATGDVGAAIQTADGASYYRFINCEIKSGSTPVNGKLIGLGDGNETTDAEFPHHIIIDRCYVHGDATNGGRRGVMFCGSYQAVIDSYVSDWKEVGNDTQAIGCWNGRGPYKIVNNYLEAAGENVMFGGDVTLVEGLTPSDIEIRNNHFFKPLSWKVGEPSHVGVPHWSIKNIFELKHARRVLVENNLFENCWADSQVGFGIVITVRTDDYGSGYWTTIEDVTFRNNEVRNSENGINLIGKDDLHSSGTAKRLLIYDNLLTGIDGPLGSDGIFCQILNGYQDVKIDHNTCLHGGNTIVADGAPSPRLRFTNNICQFGLYGIFGTDHGSGNDTINYFFPSSIITANVFQSDTYYGSSYPPGNFWPQALESSTLTEVGFTNYPTDLSLSPSSTYHNAGTDGTDIGYIAGAPVTPTFNPIWSAGSNQLITV